jgi:hypothetical protein
MDRIDAMQAFVRVVETGSFTKAAETLHASKTRVTQLVQRVETHLRVKLLHRCLGLAAGMPARDRRRVMGGEHVVAERGRDRAIRPRERCSWLERAITRPVSARWTRTDNMSGSRTEPRTTFAQGIRRDVRATAVLSNAGLVWNTPFRPRT